jgi:GWxTD domain-containing protein
MTFMETWVRSPLSQAMAWTLFHFLWQALIVASILAVALCVVRAARSRYAVACLALLGLVLSFGVTFVYYAPWAEMSRAAVVPIDIKSPPEILPVPNAESNGSPLRFEAVLPWVVPFWFAGVLFCTFRHLGGWIASRRLRRRGVCGAPELWQRRLTALAASLRVSRPVTLLESCFAEVPVVIGHMRPVVLLPIGLLAGLPTVQIEALLLHELAHIRRCDYMINLFQRLVESVLFYHPAVWWISGVIREERENCCDDVVVAISGDAKEYAMALTALEHHRSRAPQAALAATGGSLVKRIRRMLCPAERMNTAMAPVLLSAILIITAIIAVTGSRQVAASAVAVPAVSKPAVPPAQAQAPQTFNIFQRWLDEDVLYIIADEERLAFNALGSDPEREQFIRQFWLRRDPSPGTPINEFKDEHYGRIAYASERFGTVFGRPGWATDRGALLIIYGKPDELETHNVRSGGAGPYEVWLYRFIEGKGRNVMFEFADITGSGNFRLISPKPAAAIERVPQSPNTRIEAVRVAGNRRIPTVTILVNLQTKANNEFDPALIARDVATLMSLGHFEAVSVGEEKGPNGGPIVTFTLKEAPLVRSIEYKGLRSVSVAEINQGVSEAKGGLAIERPYSVEKASKTADILKTLMASKGVDSFTVEVATERIPPNSVRVVFAVTEGR